MNTINHTAITSNMTKEEKLAYYNNLFNPTKSKPTKYISTTIFNRTDNYILNAQTGAGKTTALINYVKQYNKQVCVVCPLNALSEQIAEKSENTFIAINYNTKIHGIDTDLFEALENNKSVILSLPTFIRHRHLFYNIPVFIDEAHLTVEYRKLCDTTPFLQDYIDNKFKQIVFMTATPMGLNYLFTNTPVVCQEVYIEYQRYISLYIIPSLSLKHKLAAILYLYNQHGKSVVLINHKDTINKLKQELTERGLNIKIFTGEDKETFVHEEHFTEDFDILLCTTSLTTGVSIRDDYYSIYIPSFHDSINTIPQFFARNRNSVSYGCILKSRYYIGKREIKICSLPEYLNATGANATISDYLAILLNKMSNMINTITLSKWINVGYEFSDTTLLSVTEEELLVTKEYVDGKIEDIKDYFLNIEEPSFDKAHNTLLNYIYYAWNYFNNRGGVEDKFLNELFKDYSRFEDDFMTRELFYDTYLESFKQRNHIIAIITANEASKDSVNIEEFEQLFLDKPYNKKEFKTTCTTKWNIKPEVLKNKESIDVFLDKLCYRIAKLNGYYYIKKI